MKTADFDYHLPEELIASYPTEQRSASRLLKVSKDSLSHHQFTDILDWISPGDVLVLNNTRVMKARLYGQKQTGGKLELLLERVLSAKAALAHIKSSRSPKVGDVILLAGTYPATVANRENALFHIELVDSEHSLFDIMASDGHLPLPPYMNRGDEVLDETRYQTVFAEQQGAVAAPTAGLHFDEALLAQLKTKGVRIETITLHVGAGTFQPVRVDDVENHHMHSEWIDVPESVCKVIRDTRSSGGSVVAVGTTVVRALESAAQKSQANDHTELQAYQGETDIFIYPGYEFAVIDRLITNFHLPQSTLLMLVSAFCGKNRMMQAYQAAITERYRFFSYGDAMWLERQADDLPETPSNAT